MPIEVSLNTYKQTLESADGNAQLTIPDGGAAQYTLTSTAGTSGQVLTCGNTPTSLEWTDKSTEVKSYARMRRTTGGSVNTNTLRPIPNWTNVDFQTNITCNATTGLFTVQSDGVYKLFFHLAGDDRSSNHAIFAVVNGVMNTDHVLVGIDGDTGSDNLFAPSGEIFLSLSANDTVGIWFGNHTTGAAISDSITILANSMYANLVKL